MTALRETTREFIAMLERKSGSLAIVQEEPGLPTLSAIRLARGALPAHVISFRPGQKNETPDYAVIFQCALALRMFDCPPDDRKLIIPSADGFQMMRGLLTDPRGFSSKVRLPQERLETLGEILLQGLITHLRSIPLSLRVSESLTLQHPELLELEARHVEKELGINDETRSAPIREAMPPEVYNLTQAINAAFAFFWAERLESPAIANPYITDGFERQGNDLLQILAEVPPEPIHDVELIDRWAGYLDIRGWYNWIPYHTP